jgi:hypothetical protein
MPPDLIAAQTKLLVEVLKSADALALFNVSMDMRQELIGISNKLVPVLQAEEPTPKRKWWKKSSR